MNANRAHGDKCCEGKVRHDSYAAAHDHKRALGYAGLEIYRCKFCGKLHVGHGARRRGYVRPARRLWMMGM